tara:strand:+ start:357 stop:590 length:234 start_codon:yes stop_codon:yes gene_type:complete
MENHEHTEDCQVRAINEKKGFLDNVQEKIVSRKLLVFITATVLMWFGLDADTWAMIAAMYIGGQSVIDVAKVWKGIA